MPKSWINKAQLLAGATAALIFFFDWKGLDVDPAFISMMASFLAGVTTVFINWLIEKAAADAESNTVKANGYLIAENCDLKLLATDQAIALEKAGIKFVSGEGINE